MPTDERLLNIKEAAQVLNVSTDWLYRRKRWKTLPFTVVLSERKIMFSLQGLLKWVKEHQHGHRQSLEEGRDLLDRV